MYNKELHERLRPLVNKSFWYPHECRELESIFSASEGFLNGTWRCPDCVQKWVDRLKLKFDAFEAELLKALEIELKKAAEELEQKQLVDAEEKKEKKSKKKGE